MKTHEPTSEPSRDNEAPHEAPQTVPPRRWPLFLLGVLLFLLGPTIYVVQFQMHHLGMPWHLPILASIGVLLMISSVWQRRGVLRSIGLALFVLVCGLEWFMLLVGTRTPLYTGPALPGQKIPAFVTMLANGNSFSNKDLENGNPTILLFFRGRW